MGYNDLGPFNYADNWYYGTKAPAGCVAVAMAQVLKYFNEPGLYPYISMPLGQQSSPATATMIEDLGDMVDMDYGCDWSSASQFAATNSFIWYLNYTDVDVTDNITTTNMMQQINWFKPIILSGGTRKKHTFYTEYTKGHMWVSDGYRYAFYNVRDSYGNCTGEGTGFVSLHMNWG